LIKNSTYLFLNISTKYIKDTKKEGRKEEGQQNYPETQEREPTRFRDCHVQQGNSSKFACIYHLY
jgi:hypothetical protein